MPSLNWPSAVVKLCRVIHVRTGSKQLTQNTQARCLRALLKVAECLAIRLSDLTKES